MTFTITVDTLKMLGLPLSLLTLISWLFGDIGFRVGNRFWTEMRLIIWPTMALWFIGFLIRGLVL